MNREKITYLLVTAAGCLLACAIKGVPNSYGLFYEPLAAIMNTGRGQATLHVSIAGLVTGFTTPLVAKATKKINCRLIIIFGMACLLIAGIGTAFSKSLVLVNFLSVFRGLGLACLGPVMITMITGNWFLSRRGTITGLIMSFSGIMGSLFTPFLARHLQEKGFTSSYLLCVGVMIALTLPILFVPFKPQQAGMEPYRSDKEDKKKNYDGYLAYKPFQKTFIILVTASFAVITVTTLTSYLPSFAESIGNDPLSAASLLSASMVGNVVFKFLIGLLIDYLGVAISAVVFMSICLAGLLMIVLLPLSPSLLFVAGILYGACYAVNKVAVPLNIRIIYGDEAYGDAFSMLSLMENLGRSAVITGIGFLYDHTGTYIYSFIIAIAGCVISSAIIYLVQTRVTKAPIHKEG